MSVETPSAPESSRVPPGPLGALRHSRLTHGTTLYIFLALLAVFVTFAIITPSDTFLTTFNLQTIANDSSIVLLFAVGATLVIISGGLDLSQGSVATFAAVASVETMRSISGDGGSPWLAIAAGAVVGCVGGATWGAVNGWLVAVLRLNPFVVTLGTFGAALGVARLMAGGVPATGAPPELVRTIGLGTVLGVPAPFLIAAVAALVFGVGLAKTKAGEHLYLLGSNQEAARRSGINVRRQHLMIYVWSGALSGLAGVVDVARFGTAAVATGHITEALTAIAGVVIGGASLAGGIGVMTGTAIGVFIPVVLNNGLIIMQIQRFWQEVVVGVVLVVAVAFDQWRRTRGIRP